MPSQGSLPDQVWSPYFGSGVLDADYPREAPRRPAAAPAEPPAEKPATPRKARQRAPRGTRG